MPVAPVMMTFKIVVFCWMLFSSQADMLRCHLHPNTKVLIFYFLLTTLNGQYGFSSNEMACSPVFHILCVKTKIQ